MLFHIVGVSVQQKLKALRKFEIYKNSKKIPKNSEKMRKNAEKMRKKSGKNSQSGTDFCQIFSIVLLRLFLRIYYFRVTFFFFIGYKKDLYFFFCGLRDSEQLYLSHSTGLKTK